MTRERRFKQGCGCQESMLSYLSPKEDLPLNGRTHLGADRGGRVTEEGKSGHVYPRM